MDSTRGQPLLLLKELHRELLSETPVRPCEHERGLSIGKGLSFPTTIPQADGEFLMSIPHPVLARIPQIEG